MAVIRKNQRRKGKPVPPVEALSSDHQLNVFLTALEADAFCDDEAACRKAGIKCSDLPRLLDENAAFRAAYQEIQAQYDLRLIKKLKEGASRGDAQLLRLLLQSRMPDKFGAGAKLTVNVSADDLKGKSTEELEELRACLAGKK